MIYEHDKHKCFEWIETNGLGGYACGTLSGIRTRKYHGLLNAAINPPVNRFHLLGDVDIFANINNNWFGMSTHRFIKAINPHGYQYLKSFKLDPWPVFEYQVNNVIIRKEIFMCREKDLTIIRLELVQGDEVLLSMNPLVSVRDHHNLVMANDVISRELKDISERRLLFEPYPGAPGFSIFHQADGFHCKFRWYRDFWFENENFRGLPDHEDLASYGYLKKHLKKGDDTFLAITTLNELPDTPEVLMAKERKRRIKRLNPYKDKPGVLKSLVQASEAYIVRRNKRDYSIIAGYPWFTDWGRDAMISLPGLTLTTGNPGIARSILKTFSRYVDRGMIPNHFPDGKEPPCYNTVDAPLWFIVAGFEYYNLTKDKNFLIKTLWPAVENILHYYEAGTRYNIKMDPKDGLINCGVEGTQLTWMDAKVENWVVTPRVGKPVEINALWYNSLMAGARFASVLKKRKNKSHYEKLAEKVHRSFNRKFWLKKKGYLADVITGRAIDNSLRPNQLFSMSLPYSLISKKKGEKIMEKVRKKLLTSTGLRTLDKKHYDYKGIYGGDQFSRDAAYHQGTIWPWLLGPYISALRYVYGKERKADDEIKNIFENLNNQFNSGCMGQIAEIFEGDHPENERGCFAQAWSIAEPLRCAIQVFN